MPRALIQQKCSIKTKHTLHPYILHVLTNNIIIFISKLKVHTNRVHTVHMKNRNQKTSQKLLGLQPLQ